MSLTFSKALISAAVSVASAYATYHILGAPQFSWPGNFRENYKHHPFSNTRRLLKPFLRDLPRFGRYSFFPNHPGFTESWMSLHYLFAPREFVREMTEPIALGHHIGDIDSFAKSQGYRVKKRIGASWYLLEKAT